MGSRTTAFEQALATLLPQGAAWPRAANSVWMRLLGGLALLLDEFDQVVEQAATEWLPHSTNGRLAEWEAATGLPDTCFGAQLDVAPRRAAVLARLRGFVGAYPDSSPAALGALVAYAAALGVTATVVYNAPFRCGYRVGRRMGANDGVLHMAITGTSEPFRVGGRVGSRLVARPPGVGELGCVLDRVLPARFVLSVSEA